MDNRESEISKYYLKTQPIWENISKPIYEEFKANSTIINVKKKKTIFIEGTNPKGLYILNKGVAKLYLIDNSGNEQIIYMMGKNDIIGHRSILSNRNSMTCISAVEDCEFELIDRNVLLSCINKSIELHEYFLECYSMEYRILIHKISVFTSKSIMERVALTLLVLNQKFNIEEGKDNILSFNKSDMANFSGTIRETLTRELKVLSDMKAIKIEGKKIKLLDFNILYERANI